MTPRLNVWLVMLFMPVVADTASVAPVIVQVSEVICPMPLGSSNVAARPPDIRISQLVSLVEVSMGAGQLISGGRLRSTTVTVLLMVSTTTDEGEVPVALAVFIILPARISAIVTVCVAVHVALEPGIRVYGAPGHVTVTIGSLTVIPVTVTLPVLVTFRV